MIHVEKEANDGLVSSDVSHSESVGGPGADLGPSVYQWHRHSSAHSWVST